MSTKEKPVPPMTTEVVVVTPELAGDWLALNTNNRPLREFHVQNLARQIEAGEWVLNGETIKFNSRGELQDGQHRLAAIIMANKPIESVVVHHAPVTAFETIDQGKRRTIADALALRGEVSCQELGGTLSLLWHYQHRDFSAKSGPSVHELLALLERENVREAVTRGMRTRKCGLSVSVGAVAWYLFAALDREQAEEFMQTLASGTGLSETDPIYRLRERMLANRAAKLKLRATELLALTIKAWNFYRVGRDVQALVWRYRGGEPFPEPQ